MNNLYFFLNTYNIKIKKKGNYMKKFFIPFISFILIIIIIGFIIWFNIPTIVSHMLSKEFNVPVSVENVSLHKHLMQIDGLDIGTPKGSKTKSSFYSKKKSM